MHKTNSFRFVYLIGAVGLLLCNLACYKSAGKDIKSYKLLASDQKQIKQFENPNVKDIIRKTEDTYSKFVFYKANARNIYSTRAFNDETRERREVKIEYNIFSTIRAEVKTDNDLKVLTSNRIDTELLINGKNKGNFSDVYWGLTDIKLGDGNFFEVAIILVLKERNKQQNSVFQNLIDINITGEEEIDGKGCYKIQGTFKNDRLIKQTYWIDKESFHILQFERLIVTEKIPNGYSKTVETYTDIEAK